MFDKSVSHLGFLQFEILAGDIKKNLAQVRESLTALAPPPGSLIALPEVWATGFVYEHLDRLGDEIPDLLDELEALAQSYGIVLAGSLPFKEEGGLYNKIVFSGLGSADSCGIAKQYLFSLWQEDKWFQAGKRPSPIDLMGVGWLEASSVMTFGFLILHAYNVVRGQKFCSCLPSGLWHVLNSGKFCFRRAP